ncbi:MAG: hypothetical protein LUD72_04380 [Bacteroidales bacterium]|nr:hypothetical protein [Bacteroidales bacterium]
MLTAKDFKRSPEYEAFLGDIREKVKKLSLNEDRHKDSQKRVAEWFRTICDSIDFNHDTREDVVEKIKTAVADILEAIIYGGHSVGIGGQSRLEIIKRYEDSYDKGVSLPNVVFCDIMRWSSLVEIDMIEEAKANGKLKGDDYWKVLLVRDGYEGLDPKWNGSDCPIEDSFTKMISDNERNIIEEFRKHKGDCPEEYYPLIVDFASTMCIFELSDIGVVYHDIGANTKPITNTHLESKQTGLVLNVSLWMGKTLNDKFIYEICDGDDSVEDGEAILFEIRDNFLAEIDKRIKSRKK